MEHMAYKAERIRRWMLRQGLEGERKWMDDDTLREDGRVLVSPFVQDTSHGRSLRERVVVHGDLCAARGTVPAAFEPVLAAATLKPARPGAGGLGRAFRPHSAQAFIRAVKAVRHGSAPGGSGLSFAELKCCSDETLGVLSDLCNVSACAGIPFESWVREIVYMIPKEQGVDHITKQRPLKLQESLKKITVGLRKDRMVAAWRLLGICDESQYAFLRGRSTIQPAMIKKLLLERAKHYGLPAAMADLDFHKAYDTVDRFVKEMALRRMGLEYDFIDYLLEFDRRNVQRVRTAYGDSDPFSCERGTCPQGGIESCFVFIAVMDWFLATIKAASDSPVQYPDGSGGHVSIDATIYADDASVYQASVRSLQKVVDAAMLFCGFTGMRCNLDKCWWMATFEVGEAGAGGIDISIRAGAGELAGDGAVTITGSQWQARPGWRAAQGPKEVIKRKELSEYWHSNGAFFWVPP